jgi:hypothetical protein
MLHGVNVLEESLFFNLNPDEFVILAYLISFYITQQELTIEEQVALSSFLSLIGQTLATNVADRILISTHQFSAVQKQINELIEQNKQLQKQIDQLNHRNQQL